MRWSADESSSGVIGVSRAEIWSWLSRGKLMLFRNEMISSWLGLFSDEYKFA